MAVNMTDAERDGLSEEELAALEDDEQETTAQADGDAAGDDPADDDEGDDEVQESEEAGDAEAESPAEAEPVTAKKAEKPAEPEAREPRERTAQRYDAPPVQNFDEQLSEINRKFEDGEITMAQKDAALLALASAKTRADLSAEFNDQSERRVYQDAVEDFFDDHPAYRTSVVRHAALDAAVRALAADEANADKTYRWFLREAHKKVAEEFGGQAAAPAPEPKTDPKREAIARRAPDLKAVPKTLGSVPAADTEDAQGGGEFSHLDNKNGMELEEAIARLTPEQQKRWANS